MSTPTLGEIQPVDYKCTREVGASFGDALCGAPAVMHIAWDANIENSLACVKHATEALTDYELHDWHDVGHACPTATIWVYGDTRGDGHCKSDTHPDLLALSVVLDVTASA